MNTILLKYVFEGRRHLRLKKSLIFLAILGICLLYITNGKSQYLENIKEKVSFQGAENRQVDSYTVYTQYGTYGIRLLFIASPFSILYNNPIFNGLIINVNSGDKANIYKLMNGKYFLDRQSDFTTIMGLVLLAGGFFGVLAGMKINEKIGYLRFLGNFLKNKRLFFTVTVARLLVLLTAFLVVFGLSLVWLRLQGINLFKIPLLYILLLMVLALVFFFYSGFLIGTLKNKLARGAALGLFYFASFILLPTLLDIHTRIDAGKIQSLYTYELNNLDIIMDVEKHLYEKFGTYKSGDIVPPELLKSIDEVLDREFARLFSRIKDLREEVAEAIKTRHILSCFYPLLFYKTGVEELSSCGGVSFLEFSRYSEETKKAFIKFYVYKKFINPSVPVKVENFIKGDRNVFYAGSRLSYGFWFGVVMAFLWIGAVVILSYNRFVRALKPRLKKVDTSQVNMAFERGKDYGVTVSGDDVVDHVYSLFSGEAVGFSGAATVDNQSVLTGEPQELTYICSPADLPGDVTVNSFAQTLAGLMKLPGEKAVELKSVLGVEAGKKRFEQLSSDDSINFLAKVMELKKSDIYLLHEAAHRCSFKYSKEFAEKMKAFKKGNCLLLYITGYGTRLAFRVDEYRVYSSLGGHYQWEEVTDKARNLQ